MLFELLVSGKLSFSNFKRTLSLANDLNSASDILHNENFYYLKHYAIY